MKPVRFILIALLFSNSILAQLTKQIEPSEQENWETYENNEYGFKFNYPKNWRVDGEMIKVINLKGELISVEIDFRDAKSNLTFTVEYFFSPKGAELFQYALSQYNSSKSLSEKYYRQIEVAGSMAIEFKTVASIDGKGHNLNESLKTIIVEFLDSKQMGEIKLKFIGPCAKKNEVENFYKLVESFQFINENIFDNNIK